jgi:HEAT repeat protein
VATLKALLESPDKSVRLQAALAAGTYPEDSYIEVLVTQCAHESDFFVRDTLSWALMRHDIGKVVERLKSELNSDNPQARSQALHTLSKIGDKQFYSLITNEHHFDPLDKVAVTAWRAASVLVPDSEISVLAKILVSQLGRGDSDVQFDLTRFLCALGDSIVQPLSEAAATSNEAVKLHAAFTLMRFNEMSLENSKKTIVGGEGFEPPTFSV